MKDWNDPELRAFMSAVTAGGSDRNSQTSENKLVDYRKRGKDLTIDGYINEKGGIKSHLDGKVYTSKHSYLQHIKDNNCVIKDW